MPEQNKPAEQPKTVGFVAGGIGDQLYHFTQLEHLASSALSGQIDLVCMHTRPMQEIATGCVWLGDIIDAGPFRHLSRPATFSAACRDLRQRGYDRAVICHRSTSFKLAGKMAGISQRTGILSGRADRLLLTDPVDPSGGGERRHLWGHRPFIAALDQYFFADGLRYDAPAPIQPPKTGVAAINTAYGHLPRPWTVVNLFVGNPERRWSPGHASHIVKACYDRFGGTVFLNTGPDAVSWHDRFISLWTGPRKRLVHLMPDDAPITSMIALYHLADLYLGVDSFTSNLALNCDLPAVILFNKSSDCLRYRGCSYPVAPAAGKTLDSLTEDDFQTVFSCVDKDRQT